MVTSASLAPLLGAPAISAFITWSGAGWPGRAGGAAGAAAFSRPSLVRAA